MLLAIGLVIGLVLGLTGAGGSVFAVPLLMLFAGFSGADAVGVSLGAVAASTLYGSARNMTLKNASPVLWKPGLILAGVGIIFAPLGKWLGARLDDAWLMSGFTLLATVVALHMWRSAVKHPEDAKVVRAGNFAATPSPELLCQFSPSGQFELRPRCVSGLLLGGAFVGLLSGLFGVGGGFLIVPLLLALSAVSMAQAVSTSVLMIALISSSGFISHLILGAEDPASYWTSLGLVALGGVAGMVIGQAISHKVANALLQKTFAVSLFAVSITAFGRSFL